MRVSRTCYRAVALVCLFCWGWCLLVIDRAESRELRFVNDHWPPFVIVEEQGQIAGIDVDILREVAKRLHVELKIELCAWNNCLKMIEAGHADIISTVLKHPARGEYMQYIEPSYIQISRLCYLLKGNGHLITHYEDLHALRIGVLEGSAHFLPFDTDEGIHKIAVSKTEQLLKMLQAGRIDAFIGTEAVIDYFIRRNGFIGEFDKSVYRYEKKSPFYMAISKKSAFTADLEAFERVIRELIEDGTVAAIFEKYLGE